MRRCFDERERVPGSAPAYRLIKSALPGRLTRRLADERQQGALRIRGNDDLVSAWNLGRTGGNGSIPPRGAGERCGKTEYDDHHISASIAS